MLFLAFLTATLCWTATVTAMIPEENIVSPLAILPLNGKETALTPADFQAAKYQSNDTNANDDDVPHEPDLVEGDLIEKVVVVESGGRSKRGSADSTPGRLWPNGTIPYTISTNFTPSQRSKIAQAMDEIMRKTCVRFIPLRPSDRRSLRIVDEKRGCSTLFTRRYIERDGKTRFLRFDPDWKVSLDVNGCMVKGVIIHELMHVLGFEHEHNRSDRDKWLEIIDNNIKKDWIGQYEKQNSDNEAKLGTRYDYGSVMHYGNGRGSKVSKNGGPVLVPKQPLPPDTIKPNQLQFPVSCTTAAVSVSREALCRHYLGDCYRHAHGSYKTDEEKCRAIHCTLGDDVTAGEMTLRARKNENDGKSCGSAKICKQRKCVKASVKNVDGGWSSFVEGKKSKRCPANCDANNCKFSSQKLLKRTYRFCDAPAPSGDGKECSGSNKRIEQCSTDCRVVTDVSQSAYYKAVCGKLNENHPPLNTLVKSCRLLHCYFFDDRQIVNSYKTRRIVDGTPCKNGVCVQGKCIKT